MRGLAVILGLCLTLPALAAPAKTTPPPAADKVPAVAPKVDAGLAALLKSLRAALEASRKAAEEPDLTTALLSGIAEVSLISVIHGHYALAGVGQALRSGGMPAADVQVVARDMERNFAQLGQTYGRLGSQKAFDQGLIDIFKSLQILCGKGSQTAAALTAYAEASGEAARARAFEAALDDYRGRVKALIASLPQ